MAYLVKYYNPIIELWEKWCNEWTAIHSLNTRWHFRGFTRIVQSLPKVCKVEKVAIIHLPGKDTDALRGLDLETCWKPGSQNSNPNLSLESLGQEERYWNCQTEAIKESSSFITMCKIFAWRLKYRFILIVIIKS